MISSKHAFTGTLKDLKAKGEAPDVSIELKMEFPFASAGGDGLPVDLTSLAALVGCRVFVQLEGPGAGAGLPMFPEETS